MKKTLITIVILAIAAGIATAQPRALGIRAGYNFEASYQHQLSGSLIEVNAGVTPFIFQKGVRYDNGTPVDVLYQYGRLQAVVSYDWLKQIKPNLYWYLGACIGVSWGYGDFFEGPSYNNKGKLVTYSRIGLPVGAQIGIEYDFNIPINLSLDWRPMINLFGLRQGDFTSNLLNIAFGVRYRF
jgi:hypothetical protein